MNRKYILQLGSTVELAILNIEEIIESNAISADKLLSVLNDRIALLKLMGGEENLIRRTVKTLDGQMVAQMFHRNGQLVELSVCPSVLNLCKTTVEQIVGDIRRPPCFNPIAYDNAVLEALSDLAERFQCEDVHPEVRGGTALSMPVASLVWYKDVLQSAIERGLLITHFLETNLQMISDKLLSATCKFDLSPKVIPVSPKALA
jgi:hypothetical protein